MMTEINSISQMPGILVGHATNEEAGTGCTVVVCPEGAVCGVDVRGGAPATRETDLLRPEETVQAVHAVVLSGGSAYGLAASCGVAEELESREIGLEVGVGLVPIVTGACLFDLACGSASERPTADDGARAVAAAFEGADSPIARGNVGAGTGCTVGKMLGAERTMKSGLGEHVEVRGELVCAAISAVNAVGDVRDPDTLEAIAGVLADDGTLAANSAELIAQMAAMPLDRTNTTISCIVTNAALTKAECTKVAQIAADAYAHAIAPTHTTNDGDTIFVMATGQAAAPLDAVGVVATRALELAIADGARQAKSAYGFPAARDL